LDAVEVPCLTSSLSRPLSRLSSIPG
jgi:hypothetical protein